MEGYPKLVEVMDSHTDIRIFRNFSALNIQNLIYLQAELLHLEKEWRETVSDDVSSGDPARTALQFNVSKMQDGTGTGNETLQWAKFQEIRVKLAQYSKYVCVLPTTSFAYCVWSLDASLLEFSRLSALHSPGTDRIRVLQDWLERPTHGNAFLQGVEARAWDGEAGPHNFVLVGDKQEEDAITRWLCKFISGTYHNVLGHRFKRPATKHRSGSSVYNYSEATLIKSIHSLSVVLSSLVPTISIFALFYTRSTTLRLFMVLIFTSLFTLILSVFTKARRVEIFMAAAA